VQIYALHSQLQAHQDWHREIANPINFRAKLPSKKNKKKFFKNSCIVKINCLFLRRKVWTVTTAHSQPKPSRLAQQSSKAVPIVKRKKEKKFSLPS
jgi:hypothetical protein